MTDIYSTHPTQASISYSIAGPRKRALERTSHVIKCPSDDDIVVETHQRGHTQHPDTNPWINTLTLDYSF